RIGIDPIIGLVPGVGDFISTALSTWLIFEAARLGLPKFVLFRMSCNVALEFLAGAFPILGDIFDAIWKANVRNMRLVEEAYSPNLRPRSVAELIGWYLVILAVLLLGALAMLVLLVWSVMQVIL
ncbi:MAG: DUF4112 domain-containing protein, partial [Verrucomicrobiota bacterium]|nr:DUF4112 domain-containing protein [Verrucomicrobiota bacterium]